MARALLRADRALEPAPIQLGAQRLEHRSARSRGTAATAERTSRAIDTFVARSELSCVASSARRAATSAAT